MNLLTDDREMLHPSVDVDRPPDVFKEKRYEKHAGFYHPSRRSTSTYVRWDVGPYWPFKSIHAVKPAEIHFKFQAMKNIIL